MLGNGPADVWRQAGLDQAVIGEARHISRSASTSTRRVKSTNASSGELSAIKVGLQ